jgi:hypothetical protein
MPLSCLNRHGRDDLEEPSFSQIMMMITTQQVNEQRERGKQIKKRNGRIGRNVT